LKIGYQNYKFHKKWLAVKGLTANGNVLGSANTSLFICTYTNIVSSFVGIKNTFKKIVSSPFQSDPVRYVPDYVLKNIAWRLRRWNMRDKISDFLLPEEN
jgi:hypothetical protein